ncbi:MAG: fumarylacetoacetate hydrolase family protein [Rhodocyclaceae bacterium]|nr:fumarylacetoacetate hydrolase family protein [Rhodocyclaceae bacterium]MBL0074575.1 fumarylacetoacetate hydrolase family protein [Rhodocyclaceae bacterium]MBP6109127.1 fumarylacetoacetate hydrolase family protein [Rhodocyclaceae bacterium]MBP6279498.1 fumarylacetoacetate hydrolase family protein [Rhodocyclaceae bacterium]
MVKKFSLLVLLLVSAWFTAWVVVDRSSPSQVYERARKNKATPELLARVDIAPRGEALTFARYMQNGQPRLILVTDFDKGRVSGIDIQSQLKDSSADPIVLFNLMGYSALEALENPSVQVAAEELILPFPGTDNQIAVGINYPAHSAETAITQSFVFPKRTVATDHRAKVPARDYLLDYEIELGFVLLNDLSRDALPKYVGLVLSSDYTDRATLLRHVNLRDVSSGEGFTQGKSERGFMPVGNLLIIPKDFQHFYKNLKLELWCNGEKRQEAHPAHLIWDVQRILYEALARESLRWKWNNEVVSLPVKDRRIPARTMILSGTPGGVIYQQPTARDIFLGLSETFFMLRWFQPQTVIEPFLRNEHYSRRYLKPGDIVQMKADRLGTISNQIVAE